MLIAISGSQGSGKTTVLELLEKQGYQTVKRKTSRSILAEWNVTLEQVNNDPMLTRKFQHEIIVRKYQDEQATVKETTSLGDNIIVFTERTYADLFSYALISLGKDNSHSDWLNEYYAECMRLQQTYDMVFYLKAGLFQIEHDGVRGSNHHYSRMVDLVMSDVTKTMTSTRLLEVIDTPNLGQRTSMITTLSSRLIGNKNN